MAAYVLLSVLYLHGLCLAYGQELSGPEDLVLHGSRLLNLTCDANSTTQVDRYVWFTPGEDEARCPTGPRGMCSFSPMISDDNQNVTCRALDSDGGFIAEARYRVNLKYPPTSSPKITYRKDSRNEVNVNCTVAGGKPRVTSVTFQCENPHLADQPDEVSKDGQAVTSSLMAKLTTLEAAKNTTCTCSAHWNRQPELYTLNATVTYADIKEGYGTTTDSAGIQCGRCADGNQTCNASTGHCPACEEGWLPPLCKEVAGKSAASNGGSCGMLVFAFVFTLRQLNFLD